MANSGNNLGKFFKTFDSYRKNLMNLMKLMIKKKSSHDLEQSNHELRPDHNENRDLKQDDSYIQINYPNKGDGFSQLWK